MKINKNKPQLSNRSNNLFGKVIRACGLNKAASSFYANVIDPVSSGLSKYFVKKVLTLEEKKQILIKLAGNIPDIHKKIVKKLVKIINKCEDNDLELIKFSEMEKLLKFRCDVFKIIHVNRQTLYANIKAILENAGSIVAWGFTNNQLEVVNGIMKVTIVGNIELGAEVDFSELKGEIKIEGDIIGKANFGPGVTKVIIGGKIKSRAGVDFSEVKGEVEIKGGNHSKLRFGTEVTKVTIGKYIGVGAEVDFSEIKGKIKIEGEIIGKVNFGPEVTKVTIDGDVHPVAELDFSVFKGVLEINGNIRGKVKVGSDLTGLKITGTLEPGKLQVQFDEKIDIIKDEGGLKKLMFMALCNKRKDFKVSEKYKISRKMIDLGPDPTMEKWNVDFGLMIKEKEISEEKWNIAKTKLGSVAEGFDDKIKVDRNIKSSTFVQYFFGLILKVKDAKTKLGKEYILRRVCGLTEYICGLETNPKEKNYIGEKGMEHLGQIIELFADGATACPDRAIVFLEKVEIEVKLMRAPECLFNILFNSFKRQMIELTFMDVNNGENIETILYELNRFNPLLDLGAKANMLYEDIAYQKPFDEAVKELLDTFNKDAIVTFFFSFPEVEKMFEKEKDLNVWTNHFQDLQDWADEDMEISGEKLELFRKIFAEHFKDRDFSSIDALKERIEQAGTSGSEYIEYWNSLYDNDKHVIHHDKHFKSANMEEKLFEELAKAGILEEIKAVKEKVELSIEEGKEDIEGN